MKASPRIGGMERRSVDLCEIKVAEEKPMSRTSAFQRRNNSSEALRGGGKAYSKKSRATARKYCDLAKFTDVKSKAYI